MSSIPAPDPDHLSGLVYGSLVADALTLGAHWIYDQDELARKFGQITNYVAPLPDSYHPRKTVGEQTHYGDQTLVLLEALTARKAFDFEGFAIRWQSMWEGYSDYLDHATKDTLSRIAAGLPATEAASDSEELGGAARVAPLLAWMAKHEPLDATVAVARQQTGLTHASPIALDCAEFIARLVYAVLEGGDIPTALEKAADKKYASLPASEMLAKAKATQSMDVLAAAEHLGLACSAPQAVPTTMALLLKYPDDLESALLANVMAGGDSAARALVLGMILGARHGRKAIPERWITGLKSAPKVEAFLESLAG